MAKQERKGLFERMRDLVTNKDEEQEVNQAQKEVEQARIEAEKANELAKKADEYNAAKYQQKIKDANKRAEEAEAKARSLEKQLEEQRKKEISEDSAASVERQEQIASMRKQAAGPKIIATHTLTSEETLSHLALKYYNHATKPYWMVIYEANKDVVGDNPNLVHEGMEIKIPELPPELKED